MLMNNEKKLKKRIVGSKKTLCPKFVLKTKSIRTPNVFALMGNDLSRDDRHETQTGDVDFKNWIA